MNAHLFMMVKKRKQSIRVIYIGQQLKPYVLNNPDINFMLFHFSLKYKDEEIKEFMEKQFEKDNIKNVDLWLSDLCD